MVNKIASKGQQLAKKTLITQLCAGLLISAILAVGMNTTSGVFALIGTGVCILPSAIFAFFAFRYAGAQQNQDVVRSFRKGSALKLVLTIVLFAIVFKKTDVQVLPLFIGYIVTLIAQWPGLLYFTRTNINKN